MWENERACWIMWKHTNKQIPLHIINRKDVIKKKSIPRVGPPEIERTSNSIEVKENKIKIIYTGELKDKVIRKLQAEISTTW